MKHIKPLFGILLFLSLLSCNKDTEEATQASLINLVNEELKPLPNDPLEWEDTQIAFLSDFGTKKIVGLGEATHGTSEFFKAKHRIFRYLVENHGFKIFAFEADFGESIFLNEAIQNGNCGQIKELMDTKMHFWTWQAEEVQELLEWMCSYNLTKPAIEKLQYVGVDCSHNTFQTDMLKEYLSNSNVPFLEEATLLLDKAKIDSEAYFETYTETSFKEYLDELIQLGDSIAHYENYLIESSSAKEFEWNQRILKVIIQASEVRRIFGIGDFEGDPRNIRMAENTRWLIDYFEGDKIALWAHNGHIENNSMNQSQGYYLKQELASDYGTIGFLFSKGAFRAINQGRLGIHSIEVEPQQNTLNYFLSKAKTSDFSINLADLNRHSEWNKIFTEGLQHLHIGAVFDSAPENYYNNFESHYFDELIYFGKTTAAKNF